jgi:hypothetical protein
MNIIAVVALVLAAHFVPFKGVPDKVTNCEKQKVVGNWNNYAKNSCELFHLDYQGKSHQTPKPTKPTKPTTPHKS